MNLSYETLDTIADLYTPLLLLCAIYTLIHTTHKSRTKLGTALGCTLKLVLLTTWVYGWMGIDATLGLWPKLGMDYSTHTAAAMALTLLIIKPTSKNPRTAIAFTWMMLFVVYAGLMLYQRYHTFADILSTTVFTVLGATLVEKTVKTIFKKH